MLKSMAFLACVASALVIGCGKTKDVEPYQAEAKVCDPTDNPGTCPQTLRSDAEFRRDLIIGDEGSGILVEHPNEAKMMEACRLAKRSLLETYRPLDSFGEGLHAGEFINSTTYEIVSSASHSVRVTCHYKIFFSATLAATAE